MALIIFSLAALITVVSGYIQPPRANDAREYIFQLSVAALAPALLVFLATADWRRPLQSVRPVALAAAASAIAFAGLYFLEHHR
jgi:hypothetical protein